MLTSFLTIVSRGSNLHFTFWSLPRQWEGSDRHSVSNICYEVSDSVLGVTVYWNIHGNFITYNVSVSQLIKCFHETLQTYFMMEVCICNFKQELYRVQNCITTKHIKRKNPIIQIKSEYQKYWLNKRDVRGLNFVCTANQMQEHLHNWASVYILP